MNQKTNVESKLKSLDLKKIWQSKRGKILVSILAILIIAISVIGSLIYFKSKNNNSAQNQVATAPATLTTNVEGLEDGAPLSLLDEQGNRTLIQNGRTSEVAPGKYTLQAIIDGGSNQVLGIKEKLEIGEKESKKANFSLAPITLDESKVSGKLLSEPKQNTQILGLKPITNTQNQMSGNTDLIQYPSLVLPKNTSTETVAVVQPSLAKYSLVDASNSQNQAQNQNTSQSENSGTNNNSNNQTQTKTPAQLSNINPTESSSLVLKSKDSQITLANNCQLGKISFDNNNTVLRYFKVCDDGKNGFFEYDLSTKKETEVLPTSDITNQIRVDSSPSQKIMVFTKPTGEFGIIQDGQAQILINKAFYTAPTFSPDGKYLIVADNYLSKLTNEQIEALKLDESNQAQFGQKVLMVSTADLLAKKDKAEFKVVGETYYVPRPIDYDYDYIYWVDSTHFMAGDSSKIFSLLGEPENKTLETGQPGRVFQTTSGSKYRVYQNAIFNEQNQYLAEGISKIYFIKTNDSLSGDLYFKIGDFLFRLVDDVPVQAYSKPISDALTDEGKLTLILTDGNIVKF
jgi:hypothetical protein